MHKRTPALLPDLRRLAMHPSIRRSIHLSIGRNASGRKRGISNDLFPPLICVQQEFVGQLTAHRRNSALVPRFGSVRQRQDVRRNCTYLATARDTHGARKLARETSGAENWLSRSDTLSSTSSETRAPPNYRRRTSSATSQNFPARLTEWLGIVLLVA